MLALLFFFGAVFLGDLLCRRFLTFASVQHRLAAAVLTGLLFSTCITYIAALAAVPTGSPLFWCNVVFFAIVAFAALAQSGLIPRLNGFARLNGKKPTAGDSALSRVTGVLLGGARYRPTPRPPGDWLWDVACVLFCFLLGTWLMFATLHFQDGNFLFSIKSWSDFGANLSLTQSLALGNNYPTEHPFYPGEPVRYHFLFWFLAANLSYLGANAVWAINILSVLSLLSLIVLLMTFAETLFGSRAVGRIAAVLFFFASSSLSYIPFLWAQESVWSALQAIVNQRDYLRSGFPYRGDDWGALSVTVFANQRQLLSAVGIVLIVLTAIVDFYRSRGVLENPPARRPRKEQDPETDADRPAASSAIDRGESLRTLVFCGVLIGLLPYWNSAVFVAAAIILASLFVLFPKRHYLFTCGAVVLLIGLPQILLLRSGEFASEGHSLFTWGYIVAEPTILKVAGYIGWTFGLKLVLIAAAAALVPAGFRKLLLALSAPFVVVFLFQLSTDMFNNHKLLNIWNVLISVYVAYALWYIGRRHIALAAAAFLLAAAMSFGALIDLFPVRNDALVTVPHRDDRLTDWLLKNTQPNDLFLTDTLLSHPILFTGRKVFLGNTLFAWTAGYPMAEREKAHRRMLTTQDLGELKQLLAENNIAYAAFDEGVRNNQFTRANNENLFRGNFVLVFDDRDRKYGNLKIYRIANDAPPPIP